MKPKTISIIISVYKNIDALKVVLDSVLNQSVKVDEIIVSEDGEYDKMKEFLNSLNIPNLKHITQPDEGWRKNKALNNAIKNSTSEYLIFIDGDVVLHKRFVEGHIYCAKPKRVCAGKRVELGEEYTKKLLNGEITIDELSSSFIRKIISLHKDKTRHYEDGIYISPGFLYDKIISKKHISYLIGCNFSCWREDIVYINGFNEDFINPAIGEDVDINWRFRASGVEVISCRNIANVYHLYHPKRFGAKEGAINEKILYSTKEKNEFICKNGLVKLDKGESS